MDTSTCVPTVNTSDKSNVKKLSINVNFSGESGSDDENYVTYEADWDLDSHF